MFKHLIIISFGIMLGLLSNSSIYAAENNSGGSVLNNAPTNNNLSANSNNSNIDANNSGYVSNSVKNSQAANAASNTTVNSSNNAKLTNDVQANSNNNQQDDDQIADSSGKNDTILSNKAINNLDDLNKTELLNKEIEGLNSELDNLHNKLNDLQTENQQLKLNLQKYSNAQSEKEQYQQAVEQLAKDAKAARTDIGADAPDQYITAQNLLVVGNIEFAQKQFQLFVSDASGSDENTGLYTGKATAKAVGKYPAYASYWLGRISNINSNYSEAIKYFSESYKMLTDDKFSLLALVGLTESLTRSSNNVEACTTIQQFNQDYKQFQASKKSTIDDYYLTVMDKYKNINQCH